MSCLAFRPFEDVCAYGSTGAVGTLLVPGAGLANYDSRDANPYETKKVGCTFVRFSSIE